MLETNNYTHSFAEQLQQLWSAENILVNAMPEMINRASNLGLRKTLAHHLAETDQHKIAIQAICKQLDIDHTGNDNVRLQAVVDDGMTKINSSSNSAQADEAIIFAAEEIELFEIDAYTSFAKEVETAGFDGIAKRIRLTLEEEKQSITKLKFLKKSLFSDSALIGTEG